MEFGGPVNGVGYHYKANNGLGRWILFALDDMPSEMQSHPKQATNVRCDIGMIDVTILDKDFKRENCIYPEALHRDNYQGNSLQYETQCNQIGWALAAANVHLRRKRWLIQKAVETWRIVFNCLAFGEYNRVIQ